MCTKCSQHLTPPEKKRQVLQGIFQNMTLFSFVSVELIPSLVLAKLSCWKDNLSYKKYNQNLDHLLFSNYLMMLQKKKKKNLIPRSWPACLLPHQSFNRSNVSWAVGCVRRGEQPSLGWQGCFLPMADGSLPHTQHFCASEVNQM